MDARREEEDFILHEPVGHGGWDIPTKFDRRGDGCVDPWSLDETQPVAVVKETSANDCAADTPFCGKVDVTPDASLNIKASLAGRLKKCLNFWTFIGATSMVLTWIASGYMLPFQGDEPPVPFMAPNHGGAMEYEGATTRMVDELLAAGAIRQCAEQPFYVSPLDTIQKPNQPGKFRLILDLRELNKSMRKFKFRMETLARRRWMFMPEGWMVSIDLTSAYMHCPINEEHTQYLGFWWKNQWYEFQTLPFGGDFAPSAFTVMASQITNFLRSRGVRLLAYLDDFLLVTYTKRACHKLAQFAVRVFQAAGFLINLPKSVLRPTQVIQSLGFIVDLGQFQIRLIEDRVVRVTELIRRTHSAFSRGCQVPVKQIAKICGTLASMSLVLGSLVRTFCFHLQRVIDSAPSWSSMVGGTVDAIWELTFLAKALARRRCLPLRSARFFYDCVLETDASDFQFAGVLKNGAGKVCCKVKQLLSPLQQSQSSTYREYITYEGVLYPLRRLLRGSKVLIRTDSLSAYNIWRKGSSRVLDIHREVVKFYFFLLEWGIDVAIEWWPRRFNVAADLASKHVDLFNWCIGHSIFQDADRAYGPFTVDRFADRANRVVRGMGSRRFPLPFMAEFYDPLALGNALTTPWGADDISWCFPGFDRIQSCIARIINQHARGALVVPEHKLSFWWNDLFLPSGRPRAFVQDVWRVDRFDRCVFDVATRNNVLTKYKFDLLIVFFDCRRPPRADVGPRPR